VEKRQGPLFVATRRSVQAKNLVFPLDEYFSPSVVNVTFLCYLPRNMQMVSAMKKAGVPSTLFVVILLAVGVRFLNLLCLAHDGVSPAAAIRFPIVRDGRPL
jgi:hypothetical protein